MISGEAWPETMQQNFEEFGEMRQTHWGEVVRLHYGKALRDYPSTESEDATVRVYGTNGPIGWTAKALCDQPGIIIGRKGAYRGVHYSATPFFTIDTAFYLELTTPAIDLRWAYYKLLTVDINRMDVGAAIPTTNRADFYSLQLQHPKLSAQQRIVSILSAYDDLIENNNRRIKLLEESARLLYREWFVRLRFPGYEHTRIVDGVPEGWRRVKLGDKVTLNYGKALKADIRVDGPIPVFGSSGIVGSHEKALVLGPGIIVGRKGNVGSVYWCSQDFYPIDTVYYIDAASSNLYLYYALKHMTFMSTDVAVPGLNRDFAYSRSLLQPNEIIFHAFMENVIPIHKQLEKLEEINQKLKAARDLLLPRLMDGRIEV